MSKIIKMEDYKKASKQMTTPTLYEMNKNLMANETPLTGKEVAAKRMQMDHWLTEDEGKMEYLMLLNNELKDYTIIKLSPEVNKIAYTTDVIIDCMTNRGTIYSIFKNDNNAWEIWIKYKKDNEFYVYYLFDYSTAVVDIDIEYEEDKKYEGSSSNN